MVDSKGIWVGVRLCSGEWDGDWVNVVTSGVWFYANVWVSLKVYLMEFEGGCLSVRVSSGIVRIESV